MFRFLNPITCLYARQDVCKRVEKSARRWSSSKPCANRRVHATLGKLHSNKPALFSNNFLGSPAKKRSSAPHQFTCVPPVGIVARLSAVGPVAPVCRPLVLPPLLPPPPAPLPCCVPPDFGPVADVAAMAACKSGTDEQCLVLYRRLPFSACSCSTRACRVAILAFAAGDNEPWRCVWSTSASDRIVGGGVATERRDLVGEP